MFIDLSVTSLCHRSQLGYTIYTLIYFQTLLLLQTSSCVDTFNMTIYFKQGAASHVILMQHEP